MIFREQGAEVIEAPDANQAVRSLINDQPHLMTLDLILPHKTGEQLYWELCKDPRWAAFPVVIITGCSQVESPVIDFHRFVADKGLPAPEGFLEKPIQPEIVLDTVIRVMAERVNT